MRALLAAILVLAAASVLAEQASREQALHALSSVDASDRRSAILGLGDVGQMVDVASLIQMLRDEDPQARREAEQAIWRIWSRSGDDKVDALYAVGIEQMENAELRQAIATFTRVIALKPEFAEGWNKRATLYFLTGELRKSLADCDEVIKRNPNHFGALAGYAQIYARLDSYELALKYARRALAINPNLSGMQQTIELLERLIEERRQHTI